jgi:hypothetical protein
METNLSQASLGFRHLEGHHVGLAMADGSRLDMVEMVSAGSGDVRSLWLDVDGEDVFIQKADVIAVWEAATINAA